MTECRAADLPEGSVVATAARAYIKAAPASTDPWKATNGARCGDWFIDQEMANGAEVLRVGTGKEG